MNRIQTSLLLLTTLICTGNLYSQLYTIKNDVFWNTVEGRPIYSQGGGIFRFADPKTGIKKYYWYGVHYKEAETYRADPSVTQGNPTFESVTCYSSEDAVNWKTEVDVLSKDELLKHGRATWVGRLGVAYIESLKKYALVVQHGSRVLFTLSDSPLGPFVWHNEISMKEMIGTTNTGDQTVFTDEETNKSYLIYSYGSGRNKIYVSEIGVKDSLVNLLDCTPIFKGESREGNCLFKYKGKYYMCASNIYGWDGSHAYYLVADNIRGPYTPTNDMQVMPGCTEDYAHVSQTGFFFNVKGAKQETVVFCGDRWADFAGNGLGYNQWCPLSFDGTTPYFNSLTSWSLNAKSGEWKVSDDNNYVKNGSFEADRKGIPSSIKPVQQQLTGWTTTVIEGNPITTDSTSSPRLNHNNTQAERKEVIGEKSLNLSDNSPFKRTVSQVISSTPFVNLPDGVYTLTAFSKATTGFKKLEMYAISNGKRNSLAIASTGEDWKKISLPSIKVKGGKIEIGFVAEGDANAACYIDDISLKKAK